MLFRALSAFVALVGVALLILMSLGLMGRHFIRFEPEGIVFQGARFGYLIAWDQIVAVKPFEYADNPFVGLDLSDGPNVDVRPPHQRAKFLRLLASNRRWMSSDIVIAPRNYGMDSAPLVAALARYVQEPASRDELARPRQSDDGSGGKVRALPRG
jgi:hypothetical protein